MVGSFGEVSGKVVTLAGAPVGGVELRVTKTSGGGLPFSAKQTTNSDGTYAFTDLPLGSSRDGNAGYDLEVLGPTPALFGLGPPATAHPGVRGPVETVDFTIKHSKYDDADFTKLVGEVSGKVVTLAGAPVGGVELRVTKTSGGGLPFSAKQTTNSDGTYAFTDLPLGSSRDGNAGYDLEVLGPTPALFGLGPPATAHPGVRGPVETVDFTIKHSKYDDADFTKLVGEVSGKVVTLAGAPVGGVELRVTKTSGGGLPFSAKQTTNSDGTYAFTDLPLGSSRDGNAGYDLEVLGPTPALFGLGPPATAHPGVRGPVETVDFTIKHSKYDDADFTKLAAG